MGQGWKWQAGATGNTMGRTTGGGELPARHGEA